MEAEPIIYREEVTAIIGALADINVHIRRILNVHIRRILDYIEEEFGGEEEGSTDNS